MMSPDRVVSFFNHRAQSSWNTPDFLGPCMLGGARCQPSVEVRAGVRAQPGATVTALVPRDGHIDLFVTRDDGIVMTAWWESQGGWRPWAGLRPETPMAPGATVTAPVPRDGHIDAFATRADGAVMTTWWEVDHGWQPWVEFP